MSPLFLGLLFILIAAIAGGAFGYQYRAMRKYRVENTSLLSMFVATVPIPLIACWILLPGWTHALAQAGFRTNAIVFGFGFCWGLGAITYAYGFNILGMALAASLLKGVTVAVGSGGPLIRHWEYIPPLARTVTILGLSVLIAGTAFAGRAGIRREREDRNHHSAPGTHTGVVPLKPTGKVFWVGLLMCLISGVISACANLGYDRADSIEKAMVLRAHTDLAWKATLIRWMPMYWGGISALLIFMGGTMLLSGTWRNYFAPGTGRDFAISSSMGFVHFLAQIPYGVGAYYLGRLGTTVGWGMNIGMALIVATTIGLLTGEWKGASRQASSSLYVSITILIAAIGVLAYANKLA
jgi:hypothetical protein